MSLSRLAAECRVCPYVDTCGHKRMEAIGFLQPIKNKSEEDNIETIIVPHDFRQIKIAPNTEVTIDLEDFKKEINKAIAKNAGLYGGFFNNCT